MTERPSTDLDLGLIDALAMWLIPWMRPRLAYLEQQRELARQGELREPEAGI